MFILFFSLLAVVWTDHILFYVYADYFFPIDYCMNTKEANVFIVFKKRGDEILEYRCNNNDCVDCYENYHRKSKISRGSSANIFDSLIGDHLKRFSLRYEDTSRYQALEIKENEIAKLKFNTLGDCLKYRTTNINYVKYNDIPTNMCFQYGNHYYKCDCKEIYPICKKYNDIKCTEGEVSVNTFKECNGNSEVFVCGNRGLAGKSGVIARLFRQFYVDDEEDAIFVTQETQPYCIRTSISSNELSIDKCIGKSCSGECQNIVSSLKYKVGLPGAPSQYFPGSWPQRGWLVVKGRKPENLENHDMAFVQMTGGDKITAVEYVKKYHPLLGNHCESGERCECYSNELNCAFFKNPNCTGSLDTSRGYNGQIEYSNKLVNSLLHVCDKYVLNQHIDSLNNLLYGIFGTFSGVLLVLILLLCCFYACCRLSRLNTLRKYGPSSLFGRKEYNVSDGIDEVLRTRHENEEQSKRFLGSTSSTRPKKKRRRNKKKPSRRGRTRERGYEEEEVEESFLNSSKEVRSEVEEEEEEGEDVTSSEEEVEDFDVDLEKNNHVLVDFSDEEEEEEGEEETKKKKKKKIVKQSRKQRKTNDSQSSSKKKKKKKLKNGEKGW